MIWGMGQYWPLG